MLIICVLGVETLVQELGAITPEILMTADNEEDIKDRAPSFGLFFQQLKRLLSDNTQPQPEKELILPTSQLTLATAEPPLSNPTDSKSTAHSIHSTSDSKKRPYSLTITTPSPTKVRPKGAPYEQNLPHTPDQPTVPKNPDYSGDSIESIDEDNTKQMIRTFIHSTLYNLGSEFTRIPWPSYAQKCRLGISGSCDSLLLADR
jgi:hypothetical protein